ncbi:polygalacturonase QRT3 [Musa acuminata AAA Group]|uniref:polygalacturonase QRT3 n=1 Tax=Musa acuminata AAA Group TaxID=214697 RepID=UPI0031DD5273
MAPFKSLWLLLALWCCVHGSDAALPQRLTLKQHYAKFQERASSRPSLNQAVSKVFDPISFGADSTGAADSSDAIMNTINATFQAQQGKELLPGINDLGGAVVDLQGGNYKISKPIRLPSGGGNVVIRGGTLRADDNFPTDGYLIELHSPSSDQKHGFYYEDITFRDILFDSGFRGGGLLVIDSARIRVDNCFFIHFGTEGIHVNSGHETFVSNTFLGQHVTVGGDPGERSFSGTAINLAGNDNAVTDVVIFSAGTGIILSGQANILTGVHCYNKATGFGGVGIYVKLPGNSQTRIDNCYMDYNAIVLEDPVQVHVTNAFFLGDGNVVLKSVNGVISGLTIVDNMFTGNGNAKAVVEVQGTFNQVDQVVIDRNSVTGMSVKSTTAKLTVAGKADKWVADFSPILLFPDRIKNVQYSLYVNGNESIPLHAVTSTSNNMVVVEADHVVDGGVWVSVDQYSK